MVDYIAQFYGINIFSFQKKWIISIMQIIPEMLKRPYADQSISAYRYLFVAGRFRSLASCSANQYSIIKPLGEFVKLS